MNELEKLGKLLIDKQRNGGLTTAETRKAVLGTLSEIAAITREEWYRTERERFINSINLAIERFRFASRLGDVGAAIKALERLPIRFNETYGDGDGI